jgi:GAF domain-containing protein
VTLDESPTGLASLYAHVGAELSAERSQSEVFDVLTRVAVARVSGSDWASISEGRLGRFVTPAATDEAARAVDAIQYELGSGPCVDALRKDVVFWTDDLATDRRWPRFARRAVDGHGVRSMLSYRLFVEDDQVVAGLNLYSTRPAAFDREAHIVGTIVATHGALALKAAAAREQIVHLERALNSNRDIGTAIGILMFEHKITRSQAFDLLRLASQHANRKLIDVAFDVIESGVLHLPGGSAGASPRPAARRSSRTGY